MLISRFVVLHQKAVYCKNCRSERQLKRFRRNVGLHNLLPHNLPTEIVEGK